MALASALGATARAAVAALEAGPPAPMRLRVPLEDASATIPYHRINDGMALFRAARIRPLVAAVVTAALDDARLDARARRELPIFVGSSCFTVRREEEDYAAARARRGDAASTMPGARFDDLAHLARAAAGSRAPTRTWNTACSSAAHALLAAQRLLASGGAEHVLVLGVELANLTTLAGFMALQLTGTALLPFAPASAGTVFGEGLAAVVLGHDTPAAQLRLAGGAAGCDPSSLTGVLADGSSLEAVMRAALQATGTAPEALRAVKAHATGTHANDHAEAQALQRLFPALPPVCVLKPLLGHTLGASACTELALLAAGLRAGLLISACADAPGRTLVPLRAPRPALRGRMLLNHFGFGGNNAALVLEAA